MSVDVKFECVPCGEPVFVPVDLVRLELDPAESGVVVAIENCRNGHVCEQRLFIIEDGHLVRALLTAGIQIPDGSDIETRLAAIAAILSDAAAWLDSPAFDTDRASLRASGEVA